MIKIKWRLTLISLLCVTALLSGCATPYKANGLGGGYSASKIDDSTYRVTFAGNGYTSREMVWYYWIYRCAELTTQNGYEYFIINPATPAKVSESDAGAFRITGLQNVDDLPAEQTASHARTPTYIYTPGHTIVMYRGNAIVKMLHSPDGYAGMYVLRAATIMEMIAPYVKSSGKVAVPSDQAILKAAFAGTLPSPVNTATRQPQKPVTLDDLKGLLPPH